MASTFAVGISGLLDSYSLALANAPDISRLASGFAATVDTSGLLSAYSSAIANVLDTSRIASTLAAALGTSDFASAFGSLGEWLLSRPSMWSVEAETEPSTMLRPIIKGFAVQPSRRSAGLPKTNPEWSSIYETEEFKEAVTSLARMAVMPTDGQASANEASILAWVRRHNSELTLFLAACAVIVGLLAWLYPRSTPSPVQIHSPASHLRHPADR